MNESHNYAGNLTFYDYVIDASGKGDNTSIAAGLTAAGANARVFIKYGAYTETSTCTVAAGQIIHFDNPTITLNGVRIVTSGDSMATGQATLTGTGTATERNLITLIGGNNTWKNCLIKLVPTGDGLTAGSSNVILTSKVVGDEYSSINVLMYDITYNNSSGISVGLYLVSTVVHCYAISLFDNIDNAGTSDIVGVYFDDINDSYLTILADDVNSGGGGTGFGVFISASSDDNTLVGVSKNCDTNLTDNGARNNVAALNVA